MFILFFLAMLIVGYIVLHFVAKSFPEKLVLLTQVNSLIILIFSYLASRERYYYYLDLAIIYALFGFISIKVLLYYQKKKNHG